MARRKVKPQEERLPIELYIGKVLTGYSRTEIHLVVACGQNVDKGPYVPGDTRCVRDFYDYLARDPSLQGEGCVEIHCKGTRSQIERQTSSDGYWGRPQVVHNETLFVRHLNAPERKFYQTQLDGPAKSGSLVVKLVD